MSALLRFWAVVVLFLMITSTSFASILSFDLSDYSFTGLKADSSGSISFNLSSLYDPMKYTAELLSARVSLTARDDEYIIYGAEKSGDSYTSYDLESRTLGFFYLENTYVREVYHHYRNPSESLSLNYNDNNFGYLFGSTYYSYEDSLGRRFIDDRWFWFIHSEYYEDVYNSYSGYLLEEGDWNFHIPSNRWAGYDPLDPFVIDYNIYGDLYIQSFCLIGELELTEIPQNNTVPEPSTLFLFIPGLYGILSRKHRLLAIK